MNKVFVALLMPCLILLSANLNLCIANPYGPPNAMLITIQNDGGVDPASSPLKHVGGGQYVLTEDLNTTKVSLFERYTNKIRVEKDNVVIDGANHTIDGGGERITAIEISYRNNVIIRNIVLSNYDRGILVWCSSNVNVTDNMILSGKTGVTISNSSKVIVAQNMFADNCEQTTIEMEDSNMTIVYGNKLSCRLLQGWYISGLLMRYCQNNLIVANTITGFNYGIALLNSSSNQFYQNNLVDNHIQAHDFLRDELQQKNNQTNYDENQHMLQQNFTGQLFPVWDYSNNLWQNNYWSNYNGSAGIEDSPYVIDELNVDNQPSTSIVTLEQATSLSSINFDNVSTEEEGEAGYIRFLPAIAACVVIIGIIIAFTVTFFKKRALKKTTIQPTALMRE
jgi:parallel beta-helix repeat protein